MRTLSRMSRIGPLLVALLVLVSSSASFHGYLLQAACAPVEDACCSPGAAGSDEAPAPSEDEVGCDDACCLAVGMAVATTPAPTAAPLAAPAAPSLGRVAPRRAPAALFRPPLG